jgi:hypothetical protein
MKRTTLLCALLSTLLASEAAAWPQPLMEALNRDARKLLPRSLRRLLAEREAKVLEELGRFPTSVSQALAADVAAGQLRPETITALQAENQAVVDLLRKQHVSEGIVRLGSLLRIPADLSDPALAGSGSYAAGVTREYYAFLEGYLAKIPVVLDDPAALKLELKALPAFWQALLARSHEQSALIGTEMVVNGRLVDHRTLDYHSPVYAVGSLAYSRAVTAIAATWLAVWREAHGDTTRIPKPVEVSPHPGLED